MQISTILLFLSVVPLLCSIGNANQIMKFSPMFNYPDEIELLISSGLAPKQYLKKSMAYTVLCVAFAAPFMMQLNKDESKITYYFFCIAAIATFFIFSLVALTLIMEYRRYRSQQIVEEYKKYTSYVDILALYDLTFLFFSVAALFSLPYILSKF